MRKTIIVGRNDGVGRRRRFRTMREAIIYISRLKDQASVQRGDYYLDAPEHVTNPKRKVMLHK